MSDSPWNAAPVPGSEPAVPARAAHAPAPAKKEEHVVWNAAAKPNASTSEKVKDKTRHAVEDIKDKAAHVTSTIEGYKNDSVVKHKKAKEERKQAKENGEGSEGACGMCGCSVM